MNGFAQILLEEYQDKLGPDGLDCLDEIQSNALRMGALIDALPVVVAGPAQRVVASRR